MLSCVQLKQLLTYFSIDMRILHFVGVGFPGRLALGDFLYLLVMVMNSCLICLSGVFKCLIYSSSDHQPGMWHLRRKVAWKEESVKCS